MESADFPLWLRASHLINFVLIGMLLRSGWEILASLPRLWWSNDSAPGKEWLKFTRHELPKEEGVYTSLMDEKSASPLLTLPGRKNVGLGRHWHALASSLWLLNGLVYVVLLFATGLWRRIIPTSWDIVPQAWDSLVVYLGFGVPDIEHFQPYDALQMLGYTFVIFILAPVMIATGIAMSPAVRSRFPGYLKALGGHQGARSIHFIAMVMMSLFIVMHVGLDGEKVELTLDDLKAMPKAEYIAIHTCMQGWSATSKWTGVRLQDVLESMGPRPEGARYVMVESHGLAQKMFDNRPREPFYAVLDLQMLEEEDTILAYERNGQPLEEHLGAPLRLRVESNHGYKMVKWVRSVQWLRDYAEVGDGRGGTREDSAMQAFNGRI